MARYKQGLSESGSKKKELLARAKTDITMTKQLYKLGSKKQATRYEVLLKAIQKSLGESPVGFSETNK